ncbi:MAG: PD40 domain-containing protein, partial [Verrucomicrobiales bacterium]|nr:PD40 domain-containing protein [Verrucomicrobiales bacterium]
HRETLGAGWVLQGLSPGRYVLTLSAADADGGTGGAAVDFVVGPLAIPESDTVPILDGYANDEAYRRAAVLRVPLRDGRWTDARLIRAGGALYVGFSELPLAASGASPTRVGLVIHPEAKGLGAPRESDRGFYVDEGGVPFQTVGDGTRLSGTEDFEYGFTALVAPGGGAWSAEFRIEESLLGGAGQEAGLLVDVVRDTNGQRESSTWPPGANLEELESWGSAATSEHPPVPANLPPVARTGPPLPVVPTSDESVFLNGMASSDPEGGALQFQWSQTSGPGVRWVSTTNAVAEFLASPVSVPTRLTFGLTVSDGELSSVPAEAVVVLLPPPPQSGSGTRTPAEWGDGGFRGSVGASGRPGDRVVVEASTNLVDWEAIATTSLDLLAGVPIHDPDADRLPHRFYRAVAGAPSEEPNYPDGLVSLWRGEGDATDALGRNPGEVVGDVTFVPGRFGRAFHFKGRGQGIIRIPDSPSLRPGAFTVCAWVQLETEPPFGAFASGNMVFGKALASLPGHSGIALRATPAPGILGFVNKPLPPASVANVSQQHWWQANTNTWYHLAMTVETNRVTLFLNGVRLPSQTPGTEETGFPFYDEGAVSIGGADFRGMNATFADSFLGAVDEVAFFLRVLDDSEVARIAGMHPLEEAPVSGTILYNQADETIWALSPEDGARRFVTVGTQPVISPDRRKLLFRRLDGSPGGLILVRDLESGVESVVYANGTFSQGFSWFPDSRRVALDDFNLGPSLQGFRAVDFMDPSQSVTLLVRNPYDAVPVLSPDGTRLVFHNFSGNVVDQGGIYSGRLGADGGAADVLRFPNTAYGDAWPSWSPDGTRICFSDRVNLYVMGSGGASRNPITDLRAPGDAFRSVARFAPDGRSVVAVGIVQGLRGLYRIPVDGSTPPELLRPLPRLETGGALPDDSVGSIAW